MHGARMNQPLFSTGESAVDEPESVHLQGAATKGAAAAGGPDVDQDRSIAAAAAPKAPTARAPTDADDVIVLSSDSDEAAAAAPAQPLPRQQPPRPPSSDDDVTSPTKDVGIAAQGGVGASTAASSADPLLKVFRQVGGLQSALSLLQHQHTTTVVFVVSPSRSPVPFSQPRADGF